MAEVTVDHDMTLVRERMARRLRELRTAAGLTTTQVGDAVGRSRKTIVGWENAHGQPDADMLVRLCRLYGARISDFYGDGEDDLTDDEKSLVSSYRSLDPDTRAFVSRVVGLLAGES